MCFIHTSGNSIPIPSHSNYVGKRTIVTTEVVFPGLAEKKMVLTTAAPKSSKT